MTASLPAGFVARLNDRVRVCDRGRTLVGGSPTRVVFLSDTAQDLLTERTVRVSNRTTAGLADRLLDAGMADPVVQELPAVDPEQLTVVVPVRDRPVALDRLLESIGQNHRVVVVDDDSLERARVAEVAAAHGAELLPLASNVGPAAARNAGLRRVTTPYVAFVDSDVVVVEPDTLPTLLRHFADPQVALAAPRILGLPDVATPGWVSRYEEARSSLDLGLRAGTVRPRAPVAWVPAACVVARTDALADGFSAEMRVAEDVDLVWRLARDWRVRYEPAARVGHEHRVRTSEWMARKVYYGRGAHLLAQRHGYDVAPAVLSPWSAGVVAALLAQRWWSLPAAAVISAAATARITSRVRRSRHPVRLGASLTASGVVAALEQAMALTLRHWWPITAVGCVVSQRVRRVAVVAAVVDTAVEYRRTSVRLDPLRFAAARRLDDLAYGAGVWMGAFSGRSPRALLPDLRRSRGGRPGPLRRTEPFLVTLGAVRVLRRRFLGTARPDCSTASWRRRTEREGG